jgi:broad specificity phosphatase PhoE
VNVRYLVEEIGDIELRSVIIVQHCQSEHHVNEMSGGWTDTPLTEFGREQARAVAARVKMLTEGENYALLSSDLLRASQTAELIAEQTDISVELDSGLREINTGVAAGKTKEWANQHRNARTTPHFSIDYREYEGGESWREFYQRICDCMDRLWGEKNGNLLLVSHGCAIGCMIAWWMQFTPEMLEKAYFGASPGSLSMLTESKFGQHALTALNDTTHLK